MALAEPPRSDAAVQQLQTQNERLNAELQDARAQIRHLELQVEGMKANAQRAARALLEGGNP